MNAQSKMSYPQNSPAIRNAISSLVSGFGASPSAEQVGGMIDLFGREAVLANLSARQAKALGLMTSGTSGLPSSISSPSANLQLSLESRLQARLQNLGSTLYTLTWKPWVTPSGVSRSRLRASVRRTSETETSGWVTPSSRDWKDSPGMATTATNPDGTERNRVDQLPRQANMAGWATPVSQPANGTPEAFLERKRKSKERGSRMGICLSDLNMQVQAWAGWPTPNANNTKGAYQDEALIQKRKEAGRQQNLQDIARLLKEHPQAARLTASGEMLTGSSAGMGSGGQLNPAHSRWLQSLPRPWEECAPGWKEWDLVQQKLHEFCGNQEALSQWLVNIGLEVSKATETASMLKQQQNL